MFWNKPENARLKRERKLEEAMSRPHERQVASRELADAVWDDMRPRPYDEREDGPRDA